LRGEESLHLRREASYYSKRTGLRKEGGNRDRIRKRRKSTVAGEGTSKITARKERPTSTPEGVMNVLRRGKKAKETNSKGSAKKEEMAERKTSPIWKGERRGGIKRGGEAVTSRDEVKPTKSEITKREPYLRCETGVPRTNLTVCGRGGEEDESGSSPQKEKPG